MNEKLFSIELLSEKNIESFALLSLLLWPECHYDEEKRQWEELMISSNDYCAIAKIKKEYVGFIHISIRHDYVEGTESDKTAYLEAIYIDPKYRNQQVATALLYEGEAWARLKGIYQLGSDTEIDNHISQQFHQHANFQEVNRIVCYIKNLS
jgi:aminoglycoside 6'-N-acetyltransferase I